MKKPYLKHFQKGEGTGRAESGARQDPNTSTFCVCVFNWILVSVPALGPGSCGVSARRGLCVTHGTACVWLPAIRSACACFGFGWRFSVLLEPGQLDNIYPQIKPLRPEWLLPPPPPPLLWSIPGPESLLGGKRPLSIHVPAHHCCRDAL